METKNTYLTRAIISGILWIAMIFLMLTHRSLGIHPGWMALLAVMLTIFLGKPISQTFVNITGFTLFLSGFGLIIFYFITFILSFFLAPLYCAWNIYKYLRVRSPVE